MANITDYKQKYIRQCLEGNPCMIQVTLDFTTKNVAASDTVEVADLPKYPGKFIVPTYFTVQVETAEGGTATANFGLKPTSGSSFTADPDGLDAAVNLNTAGVKTGTLGTDAQMGSRIDIDNGATMYMTAAHALDAAKVHVTLGYVVVNS